MVIAHKAKNRTAAKSAQAQYENALALATSVTPDWGHVFRLLKKAAEAGNGSASYALATWYLFGKEPFVKQNVRMGNKLLREAASAGVADACYDLGVSYDLGKGIRQDSRKAFEYYLRAALLGDAEAVFEVGLFYYYGDSVEKDVKAADIWLARAKKLGTFNKERFP